MSIPNLDQYRPVAVRQNGLGNCVISYWPAGKLFICSVNGALSGPYTIREIESLRDNFNDVIELNGSYLYISEYDIYGQEV